MTWLRWLWGEISRNRNFFQLLLGANGPARIGYTPMTKNGTSRPEKPRNGVLPEDGVKKWYLVQGSVDQSASRKRLKCQGVFMFTPLWRGTMAVYRFLASALKCMYVWSSYIEEYTDQPGKVANPARGQLNRENEYSPVPVGG